MRSWFTKVSRNYVDPLANSISREVFEFALNCAKSYQTRAYKMIYPKTDLVDWGMVYYSVDDWLKQDFYISGSFSTYDANPFTRRRTGKKDKVITINVRVKRPLLELQSQWQAFNFEIKEAVRHELQHAHEYKLKPYFEQTGSDLSNAELLEEYLTSGRETSAFVAGIYFMAKKRRIPFEQALDEFFGPKIAGLQEKIPDAKQVWQGVKEKWMNFAKQRYPALV
jgi:hypothetical protein